MRTILTTLAASLILTGVANSAEPPPPGGAWVDCTLASITAYRDHLILRCSVATPTGELEGGADSPPPREFAVEAVGPLSDPVIRMALDARARGKPLAILYVRDPVANPAGCAVEWCRRIMAVETK